MHNEAIFMSHVPGFPHDLFLSYAHLEDPTWIEGFEAALRQGLRDRLGQDATMWQDTGRLRLGNNWRAEIEEAIDATAAFLAIVSPAYLKSAWCQRERRRFLERTAEAMTPGPAREERFLKVVKAPSDDGAHESLLPTIQHITFFRAGNERTGHLALTPGTEEFKLRMQEAAHGVAALLRSMRRSRQAVFVATPLEEAWTESDALRAELQAQGFNVRPEGPLDASFADEFVKGELDTAVLAVFIISGRHDPFVDRQLQLAADLGKRIVAWLHPSAASPDALQAKVIDGLRSGDLLPAGATLLEGMSSRDMIREVLDTLKPARSPLASARTSRRKAPWVYLLYDPTTPRDSQLVTRVRDSVAAENFEVFVPMAGETTTADRLDQHKHLLRECDGVLLCRGHAPSPDQWLLQTAPDVLFAEHQLSRPPMVSKGFLLAEPSALQGLPNIIPLVEPLLPIHLEPFLNPLRAAAGHGV
jgi:hypothetical protein